MKTVIFILLGAFIIFFALGYQTGAGIASNPSRLSAYIANNTYVTLDDQHKIFMHFQNDRNHIYWSHDLKAGSSEFTNAEHALVSLKSKTLSAESEMLLKFIGGGVAVGFSAKEMTEHLINKKTGDWRLKFATIVGGVTGLTLGYKLGVDSIDSESPEVLSYLQNKKNVELIKRLVYASLWYNHKNDPPSTDLREAMADSEVKCPPSKSRVDCAFTLHPEILATARKIKLLSSARKKISSEEGILSGEEFAVFFF